MFQKAETNFFSQARKIKNIGITDELSFHERTKTQIINIAVAGGIPINIFFACVNFSQHKDILGIINLLLLSGGILILIINSYRRFLLSRLVLTFLSSALFTASAILFRNGGEYFLITNLVIINVFFNEKKFIVFITILNCLLFIGIKIFLSTGYVYDTVPFSRIIFNICWTLVMTILTLFYFKKEQLDYQKEVEDKNIELQKMNDTKQQLFSIIAHDLRSPIGQLKNSLDLVSREYISPEKFLELSAKLATEVDQLHSTLDNLLRWSISQLQGIKVYTEKNELSGVIQRSLSLFKQRMDEKKLSVTVEDGGLGVFADPDHLLLVLRNLLSNAIKYSYTGSTINIRCYAISDTVIIEVADKGTGISDEIKNALFGPDHIISNRGTANEKGTGLGLKLCREFLEKNGGQIRVESDGQQGSTFYITLPRAI